MVMAAPGSEVNGRDLGEIELVGADQPHKELLKSLGDTREIMASVYGELREEGYEIITLSGGAGAAAFSQYPRLRVKRIIVVNPGANAAITLTVANATYLFYATTGVISILFPIVVERGNNLSVDLVGSTVYIIGKPE